MFYKSQNYEYESFMLSVFKKVPYFLVWKLSAGVKKKLKSKVIFWMEWIVFYLTRVVKSYFRINLFPFWISKTREYLRIHFNLLIYKKKRLVLVTCGAVLNNKLETFTCNCWIHQLKRNCLILCFLKKQKSKHWSFIRINKLEII